MLGSRTPLITGSATGSEPLPGLPATGWAMLEALARTPDGCVAVLDPDGRELRGYSLAPRRPDGEIDEGPAADRLVAANLEAVHGAVANLAATQPRLDPVGLLAVAARRHPEPTTLYLVTSGLSPGPAVDLDRLDWNAGGTDRGRWLVQQHLLPNLTGWTVHLVGLGDVAGPQPDVGEAARSRLRLLWLDVCRATGASCVADPGPLRAQAPTSTVTVSAVRPPAPPTYPEPVRLPAPSLFALDSADLSPGADAALADVVDLVRRAGTGITITGHTDALTGTPAHNLDLSRRRAAAVRDRLVALGLPTATIASVDGVGSRDASPERERRDSVQADRDRNVEIRFVAPSTPAQP